VRWLALAVLCLLAPAARGRSLDEYHYFLDRQRGRKPENRVAAYVLATMPTAGGIGGSGWVSIRIVNPDAEEHRVDITLADAYTARPATFRRSVHVVGAGQTTVHLPAPCLMGSTRYALGFRLDGAASPGKPKDIEGFDEEGASVLGLLEADSRTRGAWEKSVRLAARPSSRTPVVWRAVSSLPDRPALLSGFAMVLVDEADPNLTPERRNLLIRYAAAGGGLVLVNATEEGSGFLAALRERSRGDLALVGRSDTVAGRIGFGRWTAIHDRSPLGTYLSPMLAGRGSGDGAGFGPGVPAALFLPVVIPGLGEVPVRAFFLLIFTFAVLVGPVSYLWLRRRGKRAWLLVTVPLSGLICTSAILLYGFFSEGFGIKGAMRSVTVLDQRSHEAVTYSGRTLYAGLPPAALVPDPDTAFFSIHYTDTSDAYVRTHLDRDLAPGGAIDGSVLPSRTPTAFTTRSSGRSRERLRFRRLESGGFEVLAGPDLAPLEEYGSIVFRTDQGEYFVGDDSGRMVGADATTAKRVLRRLREGMSDVTLASPESSRDEYFYMYDEDTAWKWAERARGSGPLSLGAWFSGRLGNTLEPGCYLARVERMDSIDDLDLDVDYVASHHLVLGIISMDDIIE